MIAAVSAAFRCGMAVVDVVLVLVVTRGSLIISDVVVVVLTWKVLYDYTIRSNVSFSSRRHLTLTDVFLRDGESLSSLCALGEAYAHP